VGCDFLGNVGGGRIDTKGNLKEKRGELHNDGPWQGKPNKKKKKKKKHKNKKKEKKKNTLQRGPLKNHQGVNI